VICRVDIDATALAYPSVEILGMTTWLSTRTVQHLSLSPASYTVVSSSSQAVRFTVDGDGTIDYADNLDPFVKGAGSRTLRLLGSEVDIDAKGTTYPSFLIHGIDIFLSAREPQRFRLLPGGHGVVFSGSQVVRFTVTQDGRVSYDPKLEPYVSGAGGHAVTIEGMGIDINASQSAYPSFLISAVSGYRDAGTVQHFTLVPGAHTLVFDGRTTATFTVTADGHVDYPPALAGFFTGSGSTVLTLHGAIPPHG